MKFLSLLPALILFLLSLPAFGATPQFEPIADVLARYKIFGIPGPSDYPDVPAIALLSVQEYKQLGSRHERRTHKIIKILTAAGKEYTTIKIPCYSTCHIQARTVKKDGRIIHLPSKDLIRSESLTGYSAPFFMVQFPMPSVEPGDMIEYRAVLEYPIPFFLEDFSFAEFFPVRKGVFVLSHPQEYSYSFVRQAPPSGPKIEVYRDTYTEAQTAFARTTFVAENIPSVAEEPYSPESADGVPRVRLLMESQGGRKFEVLHDWWKFGDFIASEAGVSGMVPANIVKFVRSALGTAKAPENMVQSIYRDANKRITIVNRTLPMAGFTFRPPGDVLSEGAATPHDFALFLSQCFRYLKWTSDLVLVNSHKRPAASKNAAFPLDLDLVFLNVKTPSGEYLLDCNRNGMQVNAISSEAINRFALGIPLQSQGRLTNVSSYISTVPFREGNRSHFEATAKFQKEKWSLDFRWTLEGELQSDFVRVHRQQGETQLQKYVSNFVRSRISAIEWNNASYRWVGGGIELSGQATLAATTVDGEIHLLQNNFWQSGFSVRQYLLENRNSTLLLPFAGELSSTVRILLDDDHVAVLPASQNFDCPPLKYSLSTAGNTRTLEIRESLKIRDIAVSPDRFQKFTSFLDQYYAAHFWSILVTESKSSLDSARTVETDASSK